MATRNRQRDMDQDIVSICQRLFKTGHGAAEILKRLERNPRFQGRDLPSQRTMQRLVKDMRTRAANAPSPVKLLDQPFEWHRLEEHGLPWESGAYLLAMWAFTQDHSYFPEIPKHVVWQIPKESFRQAKWWWRVHLAAPDLCLLDVYWLANTFALREQAHDVLGIPFNVDDLQAFLANRPWVSTAALERYREAIADGRIPQVPPPGPDDNMASHIAEATGQPERIIGMGGEYGLLRSQFLLVQVRANIIKIYEPGAANDPTQFGALATHADWQEQMQ